MSELPKKPVRRLPSVGAKIGGILAPPKHNAMTAMTEVYRTLLNRHDTINRMSYADPKGTMLKAAEELSELSAVLSKFVRKWDSLPNTDKRVDRVVSEFADMLVATAPLYCELASMIPQVVEKIESQFYNIELKLNTKKDE
jgi:hypothetical protein